MGFKSHLMVSGSEKRIKAYDRENFTLLFEKDLPIKTRIRNLAIFDGKIIIGGEMDGNTRVVVYELTQRAAQRMARVWTDIQRMREEQQKYDRRMDVGQKLNTNKDAVQKSYAIESVSGLWNEDWLTDQEHSL